jgi:hypothetical protein
MPDNLNLIFSAVVFKTLAQVDLPEQGSNQHEINGVSALKDFFETDQQTSGLISWHYFADDSEPLQGTGNFTFYDARAKSASRTGRTEWRMYYSGDFLSCAKPGDLLILARTLSRQIFGLVFQNSSGWLRIAQVLFQLEDATPRLQLITSASLQDQELEFAKRQILEELGLEVSIPLSVDDSEIAMKELTLANNEGKTFPSTKRMAELAQSLVDIDVMDNDLALIAYIDKEEKIFRAIEKILVDIKLKQGFSSVDDFIEYSLSVQNRRKSRMGYALQNHLAKIFTENKLNFEAQVLTEGKSKPDFIFPGKREYQDKKYKADLLIMLAAKSSCKERWRQILDEAERIPNKHLCTLEQAISVDQTSTMVDRKVTLVIPSLLHNTYTNAQQKNLWTINQFVDYVKFNQNRI